MLIISINEVFDALNFMSSQELNHSATAFNALMV